MISEDLGRNAPILSKEEKYSYCRTAIAGVSEGESNLTANLANAAAILKEVFQWWWVGFYIVENKELVLGPFQGPVACTRIGMGKGVCGSSWEAKKTLVVDDVHAFPGHIACSEVSKSEIVVPIFSDNVVVAVLDVDSEHFAHFDNTDKQQLEILVGTICRWF